MGHTGTGPIGSSNDPNMETVVEKSVVRCLDVMFSYRVGRDDPERLFTSEKSAIEAMFTELVKRDEDYAEQEWNYWRSKIDEHNRNILSMILETGADDDSVLGLATLKLFIDHYNKHAAPNNQFKIISMKMVH